MGLLVLVAIALFIWAIIEILTGREAKKSLESTRMNLSQQW